MGLKAVETQASPFFDLHGCDASQLLTVWKAEQSCYDTAAFDPNGNFLRFYKRGFTVWSGFPGTGKTTLIRQTVCQLLSMDRAVFLASLEEDPRSIVIRLAATAAGVEEPTERHMEAFLHRYASLLHVWGAIGNASYRRILQAVTDINQGEGLNHAFIDSLMCLDIANDDFDQQRIAANQIANTARQTGVHIHLVAHPRKLVSSDQEPDINDVAGAREIGGLADNVLFVRKKDDPNKYIGNADATPMLIAVKKQRHFDGRIGEIKGWFHRKQRQFNVDQFAQPTRYLPEWVFA